ncbi:hypothetical protein B0H13DRAFT_524357 [Mycena leptocephala]|nr:hypothetical protein B0H13DRAFT_524357 [Mycena leptocephala]
MPLSSPAPLDEGWQVVSPEWWRIPFNAVSWAYTPTNPPQDTAVSKVTQSHRVTKPPHYHAALFNVRAPADDQLHDEDFNEGDDGQLNPDLVGFKGAMAALESYEIDVGFHWGSPLIEEKRRPDLAVAVNENHVALAKERWDELVQDLTGGLSLGSPDRYHESDDSDDSLRGLHRSTSTISSIDLTDSERSVLSVSMPATPRAHRSYANIVVKTASPSRSTTSRDSDRSPRRLNAAASSFVPSPSKAKTKANPAPFLTAPESVPFPLNVARTPSPSFNTTFVFPSLDVPPLPAVKIAKDAQGFYSEVESSPTAPTPAHARTSSTLLPAFLHDAFTRRRPPTSKTRAMVDKLKSSGSGGAEESVKAQPALPQLELSGCRSRAYRSQSTATTARVRRSTTTPRVGSAVTTLLQRLPQSIRKRGARANCSSPSLGGGATRLPLNPPSSSSRRQRMWLGSLLSYPPRRRLRRMTVGSKAQHYCFPCR